MKAQTGCPHCAGTGFVVDPDPSVPVRTCSCVLVKVDAAALPARYREATLEGFWDWWKHQHPKEKILQAMKEALQLIENPFVAETLPDDLRKKLHTLVDGCGAKLLPGGEVSAKNLKAVQEPSGYTPLCAWVRFDRPIVDFWWLDGPPGSGRSTLAAAVLRAWSERSGKAGLFISVRAFSQELKDTYYDTRGWQNTEFQSERSRMAPLLKAPCLVLDDLDRVDSDIRVVRALAQLLDHRYSEQLPTVVTASRWAGTLQGLTPEQFPFLRLEDASLFHRFSDAQRVVLRPTLSRLLDALRT